MKNIFIFFHLLLFIYDIFMCIYISERKQTLCTKHMRLFPQKHFGLKSCCDMFFPVVVWWPDPTYRLTQQLDCSSTTWLLMTGLILRKFTNYSQNVVATTERLIWMGMPKHLTNFASEYEMLQWIVFIPIDACQVNRGWLFPLLCSAQFSWNNFSITLSWIKCEFSF